MSDTVFVRVLPGNTIYWSSGAWASEHRGAFELPEHEALEMVAKGWVEVAERPEPAPEPPAPPTVTVRLTSETVEGHAGDLVEVSPWRAGYLREIGAAEAADA